MYHDTNPQIIETDDIEEIKKGYVTVEDDGTKLFHAVFKLRDGAVVEDPTSLYVTNGVNHRTLPIVPPPHHEAKDIRGKSKETK